MLAGVCTLAVVTACTVPDTSPDSSEVGTRVGPIETEIGYVTDATARRLYDELDFQRATQAYLWAFPLVSAQAIKVALQRDRGVGEYDIILYENYLDTKSIWFTGNNTTIYGALVVGGELINNTGGSLDLYYHSGLLENAGGGGAFFAASGSWRDYEVTGE